jgi:uncharacterized protein YecE (DUF72 family)
VTRDQLALFKAPPPPPPVGPAPVSAALQALAERLPRGVRFGTSSWSFPGWTGLVWDRDVSEKVLSRHGLAAYAQHPLLRSVGVDRSHYQPLRVEEFTRYASAVPDDFRFLVKGHEHITLPRFPDHPRYGARRGETNPRFLDPVYATEEVLGPTYEGLGPKLGTVLLQFAPQPMVAWGGPERFAERLHRFLAAVPEEIPVAIELRNAELLTADYAAALLATHTRHCVNVWSNMPPPQTQSRLARCARQDGLVIRWMLVRTMDYGVARSTFAPFDELVAEDLSNRRAVAALIAEASLAGHEVTTIINNKAEGSAPKSIFELAKALLAVLDDA